MQVTFNAGRAKAIEWSARMANGEWIRVIHECALTLASSDVLRDLRCPSVDEFGFANDGDEDMNMDSCEITACGDYCAIYARLFVELVSHRVWSLKSHHSGVLPSRWQATVHPEKQVAAQCQAVCRKL